jgi:polyisoprenoid-binding protein YceI
MIMAPGRSDDRHARPRSRRAVWRITVGTAGLAAAVAMTAAYAPGAGLALLPVGTFEIVPGESSAMFFVPDNRGGFTGHTDRVTGRVTVEVRPDGETYTARITASIDARSLTTDVGIRDNAMRAGYLHTAEFPAITYKGTAAATPGLGVRPFPAAVRGQLTIRNVTRDETFTATVVALAREFIADASTTLRMADYGIPYPRAFIFVARDPVTVKLHIRARQP